ncbi:MAG: hydroxyacylglutathione hydrolase [Candidatus Schmidhempelia sp.]|nr:hydroxyacylglutathione hydrolase [Candidatus Schmidhempelia sp.]
MNEIYQLTALNALNDNYIWLLSDYSKRTIIIDPGESAPVIDFLQQHQICPSDILLTHHHQDHIAGVANLYHHYPSVHIYGPLEVCHKLTHIPIIPVHHNQTITIDNNLTFRVIATPGHTLGHVCYYSKPYLFCGDTLFSAGCGRIFEGTPKQMLESLMLLASLDNDTQVCCAHEYTVNNLKFAHHILPKDKLIYKKLVEAKQTRINQQMTLPSQLSLEKEINLFLRCSDKFLQSEFNIYDTLSMFTALRRLKDNFQ